MFKKKAVLPERPKLPTQEQILEDLSLAPPDDVLFKLVDKLDASTSLISNASDNNDAAESPVEEDIVEESPEKTYSNLRNLFFQISSLRKGLMDLTTGAEQLQQSDSELQSLVDNMKKQAEDIIKQYTHQDNS